MAIFTQSNQTCSSLSREAFRKAFKNSSSCLFSPRLKCSHKYRGKSTTKVDQPLTPANSSSTHTSPNTCLSKQFGTLHELGTCISKRACKKKTIGTTAIATPTPAADTEAGLQNPRLIKDINNSPTSRISRYTSKTIITCASTDSNEMRFRMNC